jgi:hypothetical protein
MVQTYDEDPKKIHHVISCQKFLENFQALYWVFVEDQLGEAYAVEHFLDL